MALFKKTTASILSGFNRTIADLEAVAKRERVASAAAKRAARALEASAQVHNDEAEAATRASAKIRQLIG